MKIIQNFKPKHPLLALAMLLFVGIAGCQKEAVVPDNPNDARLEELAGRFDQNMSDEDFTELYDLISEKKALENPGTPTLQADRSNREYLITYSDVVRIDVGGAVYLEQQDVLEGGATFGNFTLSASDYEALNASVPHQIRLRIMDSSGFWDDVLGIRQVILTMVDKGNAVYYGLYGVNNHHYLFLNAGAASNANCGAIAIGRVAGKVASPYTQINWGEFGYTIIGGCGPLVAGASITFSYIGVAIP